MILRVIAVGRVRRPSLRAACDEYAARLGRYTRLEIREVPERSGAARRPDDIRRAEARALRDAISPGARVILVTREGRALDSEGWAARLAEWRQDGRDVALVIGGAFGVDPKAFGPCESRLSLAPFTLPHELARVVLLEQLYRAGTILRGEPYHKGLGE